MCTGALAELIAVMFSLCTDMLALDQRSFAPREYRASEGPDSDETFDRERVAWTYCFLFDRNIAIRTGAHPLVRTEQGPPFREPDTR